MSRWELAARERVRDTYAAYHHAGDRFRLDELAACFAEDGVLEIKGSPPVSGRSGIRELLAGARREDLTEVPQIRHFVANLAFTLVTPDRIESSAYFQVLTQAGPDHWGRYRDVLVPVGSQWLFAHRLVAVDAAVPGGWYAGSS
jgi:ketosteroid isomerase-like protein